MCWGSSAMKSRGSKTWKLRPTPPKRSGLAGFGNLRDAARRGLDEVRRAARDADILMPALIEAALARCTLGEMVQALGDVFGRYTSGPEW